MANTRPQAHQEPRLSVVVPTKDRRDLLEETIESILAQSVDIECIVMDGGSTDGSLELLRSYGDKIVWHSGPDSGPADAINQGWARSHGEILAWLNADDVWLSDTASAVLEEFEAAPSADVVYGECGSIDEQGRLTGLSYLHRWDLAYALEHCDHCIPQPAAFIRRRAIDKVGRLDGSILHHDHDLWLRIGVQGGVFRYLPKVLAHARTHPGNLHAQGMPSALSCVRVTEKAFADPDLPQSLRPLEKVAMANAYRRGMSYLSSAGAPWRRIYLFALKAMGASPRVALTVLRDMEGMRRSRPDAPSVLGALSLGPRLKAVGRRITAKDAPASGLVGDRSVEWSFVAAHMPEGPGRALDVGPGEGSDLALIAALRGFDVDSVDLQPVSRPYEHDRLRFLHGDVSLLPLDESSFDVVINCSTIEHAGIAGRYGVIQEEKDADLVVMRRLHRLMKPNATMILTVPVGQDAVFKPLHRVYGGSRLPRLLDGFIVLEEEFWSRRTGSWEIVDKEVALEQIPEAYSYGLGCFVLRPA